MTLGVRNWLFTKFNLKIVAHCALAPGFGVFSFVKYIKQKTKISEW